MQEMVIVGRPLKGGETSSWRHWAGSGGVIGASVPAEPLQSQRRPAARALASVSDTTRKGAILLGVAMGPTQIGP